MEHNNVVDLSSLTDVENYLKSFPPGYKFIPSDEELVVSYLLPKINGGPLPVNLMHNVNIYLHDPDDLAVEYTAQGGNKGWYFFTSREKKYRNGKRPNRKARDGFWKATGADKPIKWNNVLVGFRKALVYHKGKPRKGENKKTNWIMHEFTVVGPSTTHVKKRKITSVHVDTSMRLDDYVLCRMYKKSAKDKSSKNKSQAQEELHQEGSLECEPDVESPEVETSSNDSIPPPAANNNGGGGVYMCDAPNNNYYFVDNNAHATNNNIMYSNNYNNVDNTNNNMCSPDDYEEYVNSTIISPMGDFSSTPFTIDVGFLFDKVQDDDQAIFCGIDDSNFSFSDALSGFDFGDDASLRSQEQSFPNSSMTDMPPAL